MRKGARVFYAQPQPAADWAYRAAYLVYVGVYLSVVYLLHS